MIRNIVLIVIDCLRADHVSSYGYGRATTPTIDSLANKGVLWERAHSLSSWTKPSVASLLTGLYPTQHGAFEGIKRSRLRPVVTTDILSSQRPTLAEEFSRAGWRCGAFMNNAQLGEFTRLDRGFDTYVPSGGKADRIIELYKAWLQENPGAPKFCYLHFLEAHWPYKPRRRHIAAFGGNRDTNCFRDFSARDFGRLRREVSRGHVELSDGKLEELIQMYDGAVRRLDGKVKIILGVIDALGLRDETAVVVTADHGEEFHEHGYIGHGQSLYNELTHVPLVARVPGGPQGLRKTAPVSHVDLARTLLGAGGVAGELTGTDLLAFESQGNLAISELSIRHKYTQTIQSGRWKLHRRYRFEVPDEAAIGAPPRAKMASFPFSVREELYDLDHDPREQVNVIDSPSCRGARTMMAGMLDGWWQRITAEMDTSDAGETEVDALVVQRLRDLGYLD